MSADRHIVPTFGLPYARAAFDEQDRYHVVCPICGVRCYPEGGVGAETVEDNVTKGANLVYALHFVAAADAELVMS